MRIKIAFVFITTFAFAARAAPSRHNENNAFSSNELGTFKSLEIISASHAKSMLGVPDCGTCLGFLATAKNIARQSTAKFIQTSQGLCKLLKVQPPDVCDGFFAEEGPILAHMLKNMDVSGGDGRLLCASIVKACPYPDVKPYNVAFSKPKPQKAKAPTPSGKTYSVVHLSDWHFDPLYLEGAEASCGKPQCCRAESTNSSGVTNPAGKWGDYKCDQPYILGKSAVDFITSNIADIDFVILTGDVAPHNVWETLPQSKLLKTEETAYSLLHSTFDPFNIPVFPAIGNHDSAPVNSFILKSIHDPKYSNQGLYDSFADNWAGWLPSSAQNSIRHNSGSYVVHRPDGLTIISINTNFCYVDNFWLYERVDELDPNGILAWLVEHLQAAEDNGKRVWIIGHIAPGLTDCLHNYSNYYYQIIERYSPHVVAAQFFGHTHRDEFEVFYAGGNVSSKAALNVAYIGPSITTYTNVNPGFRVYKVDTETFDVMDSITYIANLDQQNSWTSGPNWHVEYSARSTYFPNLDSNQPLTPRAWHDLTERFLSDGDFFSSTFFSFRSKQAGLEGPCDNDCRAKLVCGLQSGKSETNCDHRNPMTFMNGASATKNEQQLWEKSLCGFHN